MEKNLWLNFFIVGTVIAGIFWFYVATELGPKHYG